VVHRIKVSDEVHSKLKLLQKSIPLSFSELIDMGVSPLIERSDKSIYISTNVGQVSVNLKRVEIPIQILRRLHRNGRDIFVPGITSKKAHYLRRRIEERLGTKVVVLNTWLGNEAGFLFMFVKDSGQDSG